MMTSGQCRCDSLLVNMHYVTMLESTKICSYVADVIDRLTGPSAVARSLFGVAVEKSKDS